MQRTCSRFGWGVDEQHSESSALTVGDEGMQVQSQAWKEILDVLKFQAAKEIEEAVGHDYY